MQIFLANGFYTLKNSGLYNSHCIDVNITTSMMWI